MQGVARGRRVSRGRGRPGEGASHRGAKCHPGKRVAGRRGRPGEGASHKHVA